MILWCGSCIPHCVVVLWYIMIDAYKGVLGKRMQEILFTLVIFCSEDFMTGFHSVIIHVSSCCYKYVLFSFCYLLTDLTV
jgi:hypothetical protein